MLSMTDSTRSKRTKPITTHPGTENGPDNRSIGAITAPTTMIRLIIRTSSDGDRDFVCSTAQSTSRGETCRKAASAGVDAVFWRHGHTAQVSLGGPTWNQGGECRRG